MTDDPSIYDPEATALMQKLKASGIILIVIMGERGSGAAVKLPADREFIASCALCLHKMADDMVKRASQL